MADHYFGSVRLVKSSSTNRYEPAADYFEPTDNKTHVLEPFLMLLKDVTPGLVLLSIIRAYETAPYCEVLMVKVTVILVGLNREGWNA